MRIFIVIIAAVFCFQLAKSQSGPEIPKEIDAVFYYIINKDFPELFNDKPFQFRPIRWSIIDIDDDGTTEVFLQTFPHYRQVSNNHYLSDR